MFKLLFSRLFFSIRDKIVIISCPFNVLFNEWYFGVIFFYFIIYQFATIGYEQIWETGGSGINSWFKNVIIEKTATMSQFSTLDSCHTIYAVE